ncbi:MAG TPA: ThiF family adenylyltransferase [Ktedonobacteraceae bacterium]|nr:ThiF family adenylyltransferase [Ktedonobacteraceae bacterium]
MTISRPKIKEVYEILCLPARIRIGMGFGHAIEIPDPEEKFTPLIQLLDGSHDLREIIAELKNLLTEQEIQDSIQLLLEEGYLEDAAVPPPSLLSEREVQRYRANLDYFNTLCKGFDSKYDYQIKLKKTRVVLFGLGGIGSNVCIALAELGIGQITAVDFDRVEIHNLNRQVLYSTGAVGQLKTEVARSRLVDFNPDIVFEAINHRIQSLGEIRTILDTHPCDIVVHVADRPMGFIDGWVNEACVERRIPLFAGAVGKQSGFIYSVIPGETACYQCKVLQETEAAPRLIEEREFIRAHGIAARNSALGPACMFAAYMLSYEILRHHLKIAPLVTYNRTLVIDLMTFTQEYYHFKKHDTCPICSKVENIAT